MKRAFLLVLVILVLTGSLVFASGKAESTDSGSTKTKVVVGIAGDPANLSPWINNTLGRINVLPSIYMSLLQRDGFGGAMVPALAKSYEQINDRIYHVHLYEYIVDTAGNPLKADDVVFSYEQSMATGGMSGNRIKGALEKVEALDDHTVSFVFKSPPTRVGQLEDVLANPPVVTKRSFEASGDKMAANAVGTTQYRISKYVVGSSMTLEKVDNYWQKEELIHDYQKANVDIIEYLVITEKAQMAVALQTGTIDMAGGISEADIKMFETGGVSAKDYSAFLKPSNLTMMIDANGSSDSIGGNENLRKAVFHAISVNNIIKGVHNGRPSPVSAPGNANFPDYNKEWERKPYLEYDIVKAKEYLNAFLAETGMAASDVNVRLLVVNEGTQPNVAEVVQLGIMQLGVECTLLINDNATLNQLKNDTSAWDFRVGMLAGGSQLVSIWNNKYNRLSAKWGDRTQDHINDDKLQNFMEVALEVKTWTPENVTALRDYVTERAYTKGLIQAYENFVYPKWIKDILLDARSTYIPGGCSYDWSKKK